MKKLKLLFKFEGEVDSRTRIIIQFVGWIFLLFLWELLPTLEIINSRVLPSPIDVAKSYGELIRDYNLLGNTAYSIFLNFAGYFVALIIAIPLGFLMGVIPFFKHLLSKQFDALRFTPLPAATGIFVGLFGLYSGGKITFLAFGIFVYLLPVIVQRINEIEKAHLQTIHTLGATNWQKLRHVYLPSVLSRVSDDARVLVAVSWTYIVVAELFNNTGGIGGLTHSAQKASRTDMLYAILVLIILIGFLQDKLFAGGDKKMFKHKYA